MVLELLAILSKKRSREIGSSTTPESFLIIVEETKKVTEQSEGCIGLVKRTIEENQWANSSNICVQNQQTIPKS